MTREDYPESFKTTVEELRTNFNLVARRYALASNLKSIDVDENKLLGQMTNPG